MCKFTDGLTTTASSPIPVVLCAVSYLTAITVLVALLSTSSIILVAYIVLTCAMGHCIIFHIHGLHDRLHFMQLFGQLLLVFLNALNTWSTGACTTVRVSVWTWYCCKASCRPATTSRTMLVWCIPASSTVRSDISLSSWWDVRKNCLNCTHVFVLPACNSTHKFPAQTCPSCGLLRGRC